MDDVLLETNPEVAEPHGLLATGRSSRLASPEDRMIAICLDQVDLDRR